MNKEKLNGMSDEEKISYLETIKDITDESDKIDIIRSLSTDDLKLQCVTFLLRDESKAAIIYSMTSEDNKFKLINMLTDEKVITSAVIELSDNKYKMIMLNKITTSSYKNDIINSLRGYDEDKTKYLNLIEDEKDKAIVIANLSDIEVKKQLLEDIKDFNNRCLIVATIKIDEIKHEFTSKVKDAGIKTILIASLEDKTTRNDLLGINHNKYQQFNIPDEMKIGIEIETEGDKATEAYLISQFMDGWNSKRDTSLENGLENTSPILTNSKMDIEDFKCVCKVLTDLGQKATENCAGHIHIDADFLKTKDAYKNLIELWSNNEELIYLLSNQTGEVYRENVTEYSKPISKKVQESIQIGNFDNSEQLTKEEFIEKIKDFQKSSKGTNERGYGINFLNVGHEEGQINTIEFRTPNGSINADTWIENAAFFGGMVEISQKISDISEKAENDRTEEERKIIDIFQQLKSDKISKEQRVSLLLELCVPQDLRHSFSERYNENSKIIENNPKLRDRIIGQIATETIQFPNRNITRREDKTIMSDERNLEEAYDKLNSTDIQKTKSPVNISKGLFKEDDLIKVFSGAHDIYFNIDRESIISITKNVLDKFDKNNYADNRDFNYMIDLLNKIQSEVTKFFGISKENRMAYYYNNGRIPSYDEDTRICSMSQIKGKGVAKCAEKASCVNNILQLLHEIDIFPYDVSYLNLITQIGDNTPDGHAILEFPRTNKDGEITHFLYDIINPERVEYLGEKYAYPAIYSLNDKEYKDFIEYGTPFNNKSKFIMRDWYKPTEDRSYLGFQRNNKALLDNYIYDILSKIDKSWSKKDIVKFVHIELGKVLMYDNSYTEKFTKDDNAEMTQMSKERREKLLDDATSLDTAEQICKGMAEISAAIFNKLGIDAKVVGAEEKGEVDGAINEKTNETIVVPKIYTSKFIGSRIVTGENQQTKQTDAKAKHYYTVIDIDEEEPIIQDYVMEKTLTRIKIGESTIQDESIPGLCLKSEYNDRVSHEMAVHEDFKQRIESELIAQYGKNSSFNDRFKFIFETLQMQEKNLGTDEAINYARFMSETLIGIDNLKKMNNSGKFKFVNLVKETNEHSDLVCIYSLNGQNYFVRGNNERFRRTAFNWRNIRTTN